MLLSFPYCTKQEVKEEKTNKYIINEFASKIKRRLSIGSKKEAGHPDHHHHHHHHHDHHDNHHHGGHHQKAGETTACKPYEGVTDDDKSSDISENMKKSVENQI